MGRIEAEHILPSRNVRFGATLIAFIFVFAANPILAQSETESPDNDRKKRNFELLLKRQTYQWTPYDYTSSTERTIFDPEVKTDSVKQNQKVLIPLTLRYDDLRKKYRIELSAYELELANANTIETRAGESGYSTRRRYYNPMLRSEAEFNYYKILNLSENLDLFAGAGIRNINKYKYGYFLREGTYQEYFYTYGPQFVFRTEYRFAENWSFGIAADFFYTQGTRFYKPQTITLESMTVSSGTAGAQGIYRGYELDVSLGYRVFDSVKFFIGYNYIYSYFSYYSFHQTDVRLQTSSSDPFTGENSNPPISHTFRSGNHDILRGLYLGMSVSF
ncbi:LA_2444/LA_4059 family outer membrane protein [Leptospira ellisii]|uniref:Outer membrane protein, LA_2444/LA_4059 family n=1 Tax=Leptospira ellisii TaxID=2023197 RepID=A0A2N0B728_9LEPT|nr:hypothetical protein CH379_13630 [Leptospira ellisii]